MSPLRAAIPLFAAITTNDPAPGNTLAILNLASLAPRFDIDTKIAEFAVTKLFVIVNVSSPPAAVVKPVNAIVPTREFTVEAADGDA
jgi:hypothetical protein